MGFIAKAWQLPGHKFSKKLTFIHPAWFWQTDSRSLRQNLKKRHERITIKVSVTGFGSSWRAS